MEETYLLWFQYASNGPIRVVIFVIRSHEDLFMLSILSIRNLYCITRVRE